MLGEGMVSLGVTPGPVTDWRNPKSSPKIVESMRSLLPTCSAAGVHSMVPPAL